jgi:hypothetical protein
MKQIYHLALWLLLLCLTQASFAQSGLAAFDFNNIPSAEKQQVEQEIAIKTMVPAGNAEFALIDRMTLEHRMAQERYRFYEVLMLAAVAVISLVVVLSFMRNNLSCQPRDMVNATGLILIIFSTIIVILLADVEVQLTAAMGVLGGIAGFLFGTFNAPRRKEEEQDKKE